MDDGEPTLGTNALGKLRCVRELLPWTPESQYEVPTAEVVLHASEGSRCGWVDRLSPTSDAPKSKNEPRKLNVLWMSNQHQIEELIFIQSIQV